jgi:hypothetical protein
VPFPRLPMPSATHAESPMLSAGKKRRRDDNAEMQTPLYGSLDSNTFEAPRANHGIFYSTSAPVIGSFQHDAGISDGYGNNSNDRVFFHHASPNRGIASTLLNTQRKIIPLSSSKRVRISDDNESEGGEGGILTPYYDGADNFFSHAHPAFSTPPVSPRIETRPAVSRPNSTALLSPCHICHRKPTKKSDLDSFADCQGCEQRACFVCIRQCQGWPSSSTTKDPHAQIDQDLSASFTMKDIDDDVEEQTTNEGRRKERDGDGGNEEKGWTGSGHRSVICSRCCVERGSEGDVVCLGCLAGMEGA